jgi:hypothetical protein
VRITGAVDFKRWRSALAQPLAIGQSLPMSNIQGPNPNAVRPAGVPDDDPAWEAVGDAEPCDWCGRPGQVEAFAWWQGNTLLGRNPSLCSVCSFWFNVSGGCHGRDQRRGNDLDEVMTPFEAALQGKCARRCHGATASHKRGGQNG